MSEKPQSHHKGFHLPTLAVGFYRVTESLNNAIEGSQPEIKGPYPNKLSATPLPQRMNARIYFPISRVEFHFFKPEGAIPPNPVELEKFE
ncbi:hypothetical protein A2767_03685 [Candidatus Roizmanbacteria bacterium RIFCSPHIGHO2_01_FULL_35_10]|uniref:Uncharacterized protein n=1 Tax=Candidatus Roizmanbacteria bacterium RIFCSPLOWO2_01_FULL_35_13 TaxID=1802055 RepID=A0A1F7IA47_9BACT|nr:MAG: hypothetical protein A2767_03685 [Candidatus Roizmanbacteria bacterium RIFCSPHIGHO2_01_FULL_35_10]OGK40227.1 MAG: hypothetical protein A3A74_07000 [Candidatus Roizmanbacteria bacterium RIFCSPLOWO2_01_FULL_35_13]